MDAVGLLCPQPVIRLASAARAHPAGTVLAVYSTDPASGPDVAAWCRMRGHELLDQVPVPSASSTAQEQVTAQEPATVPVLVSRVRLRGAPSAAAG